MRDCGDSQRGKRPLCCRNARYQLSQAVTLIRCVLQIFVGHLPRRAGANLHSVHRGCIWHTACTLRPSSIDWNRRDGMTSDGKIARARSRGAAGIAKQQRFVVLLAAMTACALASAGAALAGNSSCTEFCAPTDASQRDRQHVQGLDAPQRAETKLGVILWDEYRRVRQPGDSTGIVGNGPAMMNASVSGTATSVR
jgi:hypothetical protein